MPLVPVLDTLETDRLTLRHRRVDEAAIYRQLWTERDPRVPPHRQIDSEGRPTVEDIAAQIRAEREESGPGILAVERKGTADVMGYCGGPGSRLARNAVATDPGGRGSPRLAAEATQALTHPSKVVMARAASRTFDGSGASRARTGDLLAASQTLSQLSYGPWDARL